MSRYSLNFKLALAALVSNVIVILQGALVRATGSGAGCGQHWPTCNGTIVPLAPSIETLIEFSHRLLSLTVLILGVVLVWQAFRSRQQQKAFFILP
ncbi:MAG: COX15/CtaA family protein [Deinococcales bacterium]